MALIATLAEGGAEILNKQNALAVLLGSLFGGAVLSGYILAKLRSKTAIDVFARTLLFGIIFTGFYAAIGFAGCLVLVTR